MATRVGINGFGRIGRQVFKAVRDYYPDAIEIVAVNDLTDTETLAYLLKYDTNYGEFDGEIEAAGAAIIVDDQRIRVSAEKDPRQLPWRDLGVDVVVESTGRFTDGAHAAAHLQAGAKKVIISAPAQGEDLTIVIGVNEGQYDPARHHILSNASCTTNCLAPVAQVILDHFGIVRGMMTTIHSYTNDQVILDFPHKDKRRARAAAQNIIPTTTGAAQAVALVIPALKGKFAGFALRVPTPTVSLIDFVAETERPVTVQSVNQALMDAAERDPRAILDYTDEPLVSMDFKGDPHSAIVDGLSTMVLGETLVKVVAWYDNEWAYACRVADLTAYIAERGL
ncbi:MAG TPA: type I glyceraldehyde-3-phosphate dehydrogenase [Chloroflexia bacterium]|nr:type I glyceraldehyde-3-phosphate dehydrogenase [Chloroflexia bacterium]